MKRRDFIKVASVAPVGLLPFSLPKEEKKDSEKTVEQIFYSKEPKYHSNFVIKSNYCGKPTLCFSYGSNISYPLAGVYCDVVDWVDYGHVSQFFPPLEEAIKYMEANDIPLPVICSIHFEQDGILPGSDKNIVLASNDKITFNRISMSDKWEVNMKQHWHEVHLNERLIKNCHEITDGPFPLKSNFRKTS
jgi:hypothetical protein